MSKPSAIEKGFQPVYSSTEKLTANGLDTRGIEKLTAVLLSQISGQIEELLPVSVCKENRLISREDAIIEIHKPTNSQKAEQARIRLKFEDV